MSETPILHRPALAVLLAVVFAAGMTYYHLGVFLPRSMQRAAERGMGGGYSFGNDFYPIWLTSRQALDGEREPYSAETTQQIQLGLFGRPIDGRADPESDGQDGGGAECGRARAACVDPGNADKILAEAADGGPGIVDVVAVGLRTASVAAAPFLIQNQSREK